MGKGTDAARSLGNHVQADLIDDFKDQLVIVLMKRLADKDGKVIIPLAEMDDTSQDMLGFKINPDTKAFHFILSKKS